MNKCIKNALERLNSDICTALQLEFKMNIELIPESDAHDNFIGNICDRAIDLKVVSQDWFDNRLKHSDYERLIELQPLILETFFKMKNNDFDFYFNEDTIKHYANDIIDFVILDCETHSEEDRKKVTIDLGKQILEYLKEYNYENSK